MHQAMKERPRAASRPLYWRISPFIALMNGMPNVMERLMQKTISQDMKHGERKEEREAQRQQHKCFATQTTGSSSFVEQRHRHNSSKKSVKPFYSKKWD